jgi:hypothetical protein
VAEKKKHKKLGPKETVIAAILVALEYKSTADCEKVLLFINSLPVNGGQKKNGDTKE